MRKGTNLNQHQQKSLSHYGKFVKSVRLLNHSLQTKTEYCIKYVALYFIHPLFATCYVFILLLLPLQLLMNKHLLCINLHRRRFSACLIYDKMR